MIAVIQQYQRIIEMLPVSGADTAEAECEAAVAKAVANTRMETGYYSIYLYASEAAAFDDPLRNNAADLIIGIA